MSNAGHRLGFVTGLATEAKILRQAAIRYGQSIDRTTDILVACAGASDLRAHALAGELLGAGATVLVSFGIAGGLDPARRAGDLILATTVLDPNGEPLSTDPDWRKRLVDILGDQAIDFFGGAIAGAQAPLMTSEEKIRCHQSSGAIAVDMESHAIAAAAKAAKVPFLAVRVIADQANQSLPSSVLGAIADDGRPRPMAVVGKLLIRPWELGDLVRLARSTRQALDSLERFSAAAAPLLFGGL